MSKKQSQEPFCLGMLLVRSSQILVILQSYDTLLMTALLTKDLHKPMLKPQHTPHLHCLPTARDSAPAWVPEDSGTAGWAQHSLVTAQQGEAGRSVQPKMLQVPADQLGDPQHGRKLRGSCQHPLSQPELLLTGEMALSEMKCFSKDFSSISTWVIFVWDHSVRENTSLSKKPSSI